MGKSNVGKVAKHLFLDAPMDSNLLISISKSVDISCFQSTPTKRKNVDLLLNSKKKCASSSKFIIAFRFQHHLSYSLLANLECKNPSITLSFPYCPIGF